MGDDLAPIGYQQSASMYLAVEPIEATDALNPEDGSKFAARQLDSLLQGREVKGSHPSDILLHHTSLSSVSAVLLSLALIFLTI